MSAAASSISVDTAALQKAFAAAPEIVMDHLAAGVLEGLFLLQHETAERTPAVHGNLRNSILAQPLERDGTVITGTMGTALVYAEPVESGTRPHWVPLAPLEEWVRARGLHLKQADGTFRKKSKSKKAAQADAAKIAAIAQAIQRKIGHHGTQGQFMFQRAFDAATPELNRIMNAAAERGIEAVAGMAS